MKSRLFVLPALVLLAASAFADDEDKVKAKDMEGSVEVLGIDGTGAIVGDGATGWITRDARGKVTVSAKGGEVNKIETYLDWTAAGEVHGHVWEKLWVSGDAYTGWSERQISSSNAVIFSRTVINGSISQRIHPDGSGVIKWTVGDDTSSASDTTGSSSSDTSSASPTPTPKPLPTVDIDEEGSFTGSFFRQIEIKPRNHDRASIKFTDEGYERMTVTDGGQLLTVQERVALKGTGKGNLGYNPTPAPTPSPSPSPTASPNPTVTPFPTPGDVIGG
jgi:hypothetical protein